MDINTLSEKELVSLNQRVIDRLKQIRTQQNQKVMMEFRVGQAVTFSTDSGEPVFGLITRINQKTISIASEEGTKWKVSPQLLQPVNLEIAAKPKLKPSSPTKAPSRNKPCSCGSGKKYKHCCA